MKTFIWKNRSNKQYQLKHWFQLWITEAYSVRRLSQLSGYGKTKIQTIKNYWLKQIPKQPCDLRMIKYVIYDGTYFHKDGCLMNLMNAADQKIIAHSYADKEGFKSTYPWFLKLKEQGLYPIYVIMDGEKSVIRAIRSVWPKVKIQRCLWHIQREGMRWLRTYPKTQAGRDLRYLLMTLCRIKSEKERIIFVKQYQQWFIEHRKFVMSLPSSTIAFKDLRKAMSLIKNALENMFYYLKDQNVHSTTNALESFHSRLKADYRRHRGLSEHHKIQYLSWYCYFNNNKK